MPSDSGLARFAECASLAAIDHELQAARTQQARWENRVRQLTELHDLRQSQIEAGTWPPPKENPDAR